MHAHGGLPMAQNFPGKPAVKLTHTRRALSILTLCTKRRYYWDRQRLVMRTEMCSPSLLVILKLSFPVSALLQQVT